VWRGFLTFQTRFVLGFWEFVSGGYALEGVWSLMKRGIHVSVLLTKYPPK
jgi:hypothetical protein